MLRNSILGALAGVAGLKAAEQLAYARRRQAPSRPAATPVSINRVGDFTTPYKRNPDQTGPRPSHTYRWARRTLAKLIRKGHAPGAGSTTARAG